VTSKLLINEPPLQFQPSLAVVVGLNEAIVLQQLHYWLQRSGKERDGRMWVYNSFPEWKEQFPFWSEDTIKRTMKSLRDAGIVMVGNYNTASFDRTLWYSIDYDLLNASSQNAPTIGAKCTDARAQDAPTNTNRILHKTTTETTTLRVAAPQQAMFSAIMETCQLDAKLKRGQIARTAKQLLEAGYTPEDVQKFKTWWTSDTWKAQHTPVPTITKLVELLPQSKTGVVSNNVRNNSKVAQSMAALARAAARMEQQEGEG
jgi:hypothetical protein